MSKLSLCKLPPKTLSFIGGAVTAIPIVFPKLFFIGFVSFAVPGFIEYVCRDKNERYRSAYARGLSFFMGFGTVLFSWFCSLYPLDFAGLTKPAAIGVIILGWFGLSLLQASFSALLFLQVRVLIKKCHMKKHPLALSLCFALVYTVFEWMSTKTWAAVPWGRLAVGQTEALPMIQIASVVGGYGVTFILVFAGVALGVSLARFIESGKRAEFLPVLVAAALLFGNITFGCVRLSLYRVPEDSVKISAAAIQGNMSSHDKWSSDTLDMSLETFYRLSMEAASDGAEIIVLPETAVAYNIDGSSGDYIKSAYERIARDTGAYLVVGVFTKNDEGVSENSVVVFSPDEGLMPDKYVKRHLVPFGEYVPMRDFVSAVFPPLSDIGMLASDLSAGIEPSLLDTEFGLIAPIICFDSIYEPLTIDSMRAGGQLITLSTNDSWFLDSHGVYEHNRHAVLRGVESGRYIVRSANTGISSVISPTGEMLKTLPPLEQGYVTSDVYMIDDNTVYTTIGNLFIPLSVAGIVLLSLYSFLKERRQIV